MIDANGHAAEPMHVTKWCVYTLLAPRYSYVGRVSR